MATSTAALDDFSERLKDPAQAADKKSQGDLSEQVTAHSMSANIDRAHIELIQQVQNELRTPVHGLAQASALTSPNGSWHDHHCHRLWYRQLGTLEELRAEVHELTIRDDQRNSVLVKLDSLGGLADRLQHVLDDFKDLASQAIETINARQAEENYEVNPKSPVDLGELLDQVASDAWNAQVRQIRAEGGAEARLPPPPELILQTVTSLRDWKTVVNQAVLRKLSYKLISNALRFTKEGYVELSLSPAVATPPPYEKQLSLDAKEAPRSSENFVELVIKDTGEGMAEDFLSRRLFQPFVKADKFKAGAGLSMTLCSSLVRQIGGMMHVSSDRGRGTVVTVRIPVQSQPGRIIEPVPPSQTDQFIFLYGFEGYGLQRLAQVITGQLATFGNLFCTTHIEDADYLLLPEEVCFQVSGGIDAILQQTKAGVKIGVLQAYKDAEIEYAALKNGSRQVTYVTRKPFGPRCFAGLLQLAEKDPNQIPDASEGARKKDGHLDYAAEALSESSTPIRQASPDSVLTRTPLPQEISVGPLDEAARAQRAPLGDTASAPLSKAEASQSTTTTTTTTKKRSIPSGAERPRFPRTKSDKMSDLVVSPRAMDSLLRAPNPAPKVKQPASVVDRRPDLVAPAFKKRTLPGREFSGEYPSFSPFPESLFSRLSTSRNDELTTTLL